MNYNALEKRYPSIRPLVYGKKGMVCTSQPLAAQAGLDVLKKGGNALDAALAVASCLTVLEPNSNGIGSDCFCMVWKDGKLYGMNGSGPSPAGLNADVLKEAGLKEIPERGWIPVMVPGAPGAWAAIHERFGKRTMLEDFEAAIRYAKEGYPVSPVIAHEWRAAVKELEAYREDPLFAEWFRVFTKDGEGPQAGDFVTLPDHAKTLQEIAETKAESFYRGAIAEQIDAYARATGGLLRKEDLAEYQPQWVEPISVDYHGYQVWELPPNGHGILALMALNIIKHQKLIGHDDPDTIHRQIEAMKLAFERGLKDIADPACMKVSVEELLDPEYARSRSALIGETARDPEKCDPYCGGTVYLCTADEDGMMVSFIQSGFGDFGSGIVVPGTGICLLDRGCGFSLDPENPNYIGPKKRSYHTIIPGFLSKDGEGVGPFGVMGALMQPQGHFQLLMNLLDFGMNPQDALNAPRWQWRKDNRVELEASFGEEIYHALEEKGHVMYLSENTYDMGRGQIILRDKNGVYTGASEPRADGYVAAW